MTKRVLSFMLAVTVMLCMTVPAYANYYDIEYSSVVDNPLLRDIIKNSVQKRDDVVYPPDEHPRLLLNKDYVNFLKENKDREDIAGSYKYVMDLAAKELPTEKSALSTALNNQLSARAFAYAMGEVNKVSAKETIDYTIEYLTGAVTNESYSISVYKDYGTAAGIGAKVFDWCYDAMSASQKDALGAIIRKLIYDPIQPCRPDNVDSGWSDIVGKAVGEPLIYNSEVAIALYDEYPEIYDAVMPKIQGHMADIMKIYGQAGALTDGSIAYTRNTHAYKVSAMFERLGYKNFYGDQTPSGYKMLYSRLPYGALIKQGDDFSQGNYRMGDYTARGETDDMGLLGVQHDDPYLLYQYDKINASAKSLDKLLYNISYNNVEGELPDELPLSYYVGEPRSEIMARTSWLDGMDSPAVVAYMNMNNRRSGDHDHAEMGSFQIYYKGPLTIPGGIYAGEAWGGSHWANYATRSISKNTMLVYDPSEVFTFGSTVAEANDGGQMMVGNKNGGFTISDYEEHMSDANLRTVTESHYIGPNEKTPAFSYIKGDLTNAYSGSKMETYKRGMVFMDLFNEEYPGAMVVFDRVVSKDASFKKTFLLQSCFEPQIEGNKVTIKITEDGGNGKLVNNTLLPEKADIKSVGGEGMEFSVNGKNYPPDKESTGTDYYMGGWRSEISPSAANKEDLFLNAMYVTDADGNAADLPMIKENTELFTGVTVLDRYVMFSKSGEFVNKEFKINVRDNGYSDVMCLLTDVETGKWKITGNSTDITVEVGEDSHCLMFTAAPGEYTVSPASDGAVAETVEYPEISKVKTGDFAIKQGKSYTHLDAPNKLVNGVPYVAAESFLKKIVGVEATLQGDSLTFNIDGTTYTIKADTAEFTMNIGGSSLTANFKNIPLMIDGILYVNFDSVGGQFGLNVSYNTRNKTLTPLVLSSASNSAGGKTLAGVDESKVLWPLGIDSSSHDGNVPENTIDRDLGTRWSSEQGDGEWVSFDLGEVKDIASVLIAFYNGDKRNWKFDIQISADGENYSDVLVDQKSSGSSLNPEEFKLPDGTKARFVRYVGHGEEVTKSFYNSLTQFIIVKK